MRTSLNPQGRELLAAAARLRPSAAAPGPSGPQDSPSDNDMQEEAQADGSPAGLRRCSSTNNHMTSDASPDASNRGAGDPASSPQSQAAGTFATAATSPGPSPQSPPLPPHRPLSPATAARALHEAFLELDGQLGEEERVEQLRALSNTAADAATGAAAMQDAGSAGTAGSAPASQTYGRWARGLRVANALCPSDMQMEFVGARLVPKVWHRSCWRQASAVVLTLQPQAQPRRSLRGPRRRLHRHRGAGGAARGDGGGRGGQQVRLGGMLGWGSSTRLGQGRRVAAVALCVCTLLLKRQRTALGFGLSTALVCHRACTCTGTQALQGCRLFASWQLPFFYTPHSGPSVLPQVHPGQRAARRAAPHAGPQGLGRSGARPGHQGATGMAAAMAAASRDTRRDGNLYQRACPTIHGVVRSLVAYHLPCGVSDKRASNQLAQAQEHCQPHTTVA